MKKTFEMGFQILGYFDYIMKLFVYNTLSREKEEFIPLMDE